MFSVAPPVTNRPQLPPGLNLANNRPPTQGTLSTEKVQVVESQPYAPIAEVTNADLLKAMQDLSQKVHTLSKNQQALESRLERLQKKADAIDYNTIAGSVWLSRWSYCIVMNLCDPPTYFWPDGMNTPHWK